MSAARSTTRARLGAVAVGLALTGALTACSASSTGSGGPSKDELTGATLKIISVNDSAVSNPFQATANIGLQAAGKNFGAKVTYLGPATSNTFTAAQQVQLLKSAIAQRPDGLIVDDATPGLDAVLQSAVKSGIPVVLYIDGQDKAQSAGAITYVGSDDLQVGQNAGEHMASVGAKDALCVTVTPGLSPQLDKRCKGFDSEFAKDGRTAKNVILSNPSDAQGSQNQIEAAIQKDKNVDAVWVVGSPVVPAMLGAVSASGRSGIKTGAVDSTESVLEEIQSGKLGFTESIQGYLQGYYAVQYLAQYIRLGAEPTMNAVTVGPRLVDSSNVAKLLSVCKTDKVC